MVPTLIVTRPRTNHSRRSPAAVEGFLRDVAYVLHLSDRLAHEIRGSRPAAGVTKMIPRSDELLAASYN